MNLTRRDLGKLAIAALPAARLLAKTNSKFGGVQIGINAPYSFHGEYNSGDECLGAMVKLNLSAVELRAQPIENSWERRPTWSHIRPPDAAAVRQDAAKVDAADAVP